MAQLFDITKVTVAPNYFEAEVRLSEDAPVKTSDDPEGTARIMELLPELADHTCLGDVAPKFGDVVEDTELAHLLEHVTVELLARTDIAGDVLTGRTFDDGDGAFAMRFPCPDDVLVAAALSSADWIIEWAYNGGGEPTPDVDAIAKGLVGLVADLPVVQIDPEVVEEFVEETAEAEPEVEPEPEPEVEPEPEPEADTPAEPVADPAATLVSEPVADPATEVEDGYDFEEPEFIEAEEEAVEAEAEPESEPEPERDIYDDSNPLDEWDMMNIPKPKTIR